MNPGPNSGTAHEELGDLFEFWSPNAILQYIATVGRGYDALQSDITNANAFDSSNANAWALVYTSFKKFQKSTGYIGALSLGSLRTAEEYARQLVYWREQFEKKSGRAATGATVEIPGAQQQASVNKLIVVGGVLIGAYFLAQALQLIPRRA